MKTTFMRVGLGLILLAGSAAQGGTLTLANDYVAGLNTDATNTVEVARNFAAILGGPLTGSGTLTLKGGYIGAASSMLSLINGAGNTFSGHIVVDTDGGTLRLAGNPYAPTATGLQGLTLPSMTAANTITVRRGAALNIEDNAVNGATTYLADRLGMPGNRPAVSLAGGTLTLSGANAAATNVQTLGALTLAAGPSTITVTRNTAGTPQLIFSSLTPLLGGTANFTGTSLGTAAANVGQILFNTAPTLVGGIIGGYARSGNEWATYGANGVMALASGSYGSTIQDAAATANIKVTVAQTITADNTLNSLNWNYNGNLDLTTYRLTLVSGGLLKLNNNGNSLLGTTGYVTAGAGDGVTTALNVYQNQNQTLTWSALVKDNPAGSGNAVAFVKDGSGPGTVSFTQADDNTYSGGTFVNTGTLRTGGTAGRRYLGTGPVRVDNAWLTLGATGATSYAEADQAGYTAANGGQIVVANASFTSPGDRFNIGAGCILSGNATTTAGNGLNSIARVAGLAGIAGGQAVLAPGSIVAFGGTLTTGLGAGVLTLTSGAGTDADLYFGLAANAVAASTITVGTGTPWRGISTDRTTRNFASGTITANGDFDLQGYGAPGVAPVALNMGSSGAIAINTPNGDVAVNILGAVTWSRAATALGSDNHNLVFRVKPGATFTLTPANALGASEGSTVTVVVEAGGTLAIGNAAALNTAVTVEAGGRLIANQAGGLTGTGALTFESGSILDVTGVAGFSGAQATTATLQPGVIVRLEVASFGSTAEPLDTFLAAHSPVYEIYGANRAPANPSSAGATVMTLNRGAGSAGGLLVNDLTSRTFTAVSNGKIAIGTNGGVMGATANTTLTVPYPIALGTNELVIGSAAPVDGAPPKNGTVDLSAASFSAAEAGSRISIRSGTLKVTGNVLPSVTDVSLASPGVLNLTAGTNAVRYLTVDGVKYFAGVYGSNSLPRHITGPGMLQTEAPPELLCWVQPDKVMGVTNETVTFRPLLSGNNTNIIAYVWDLNDDGSIDSTFPTVSTQYATGGVYKVRLTVTNDNSESATFLWTDSIFIYLHKVLTWGGGAAANNFLASDPANWAGGEIPLPGDHVVLDARTNKNMTWDLNIPVQTWTQNGYVGTVTVATVYPGRGVFTNFTVIGDCTISNGVWTQTVNPNGNTEVNRLCVTIGGDLIVGPNAAMNVTSKGYASQCGPGSGYNGLGASHGGVGSGWGGPSKPCYGSLVAPTNLGSGSWSSIGGGAILLTVGGTVWHEGLLASDGMAGNYHSAGGSIYLTAGALRGNGLIRANAGPGAAGGGRIALVVTNAGAGFGDFTNAVTAYGFTGGGAGTVYWRTANQGLHEGTVIVDNNNNANATVFTVISSNVTDTVVGNVLIRNKGYLLLYTNQSLTLSGVWSNAASFAGHTDSQIIFSGPAASTSTLFGNTTFMGLTCTNAGGKTLLFEAGKTNSVAALGRLTLNGLPSATNLVLRSTSDGEPWKLNVNGSANQSVRNVDVKDSDASLGASIGAFDSIDRGGNRNWAFVTPGETNEWTGAISTAWGATNNWSRGRAPLTEDFVSIPAGRPRYPVFDTAKILTGGLKIENGASLNLAGYNLTMITNAVVAGTLTAINTETITLMADADFTGGTFTSAFSTVIIGGAGDQSIKLGDQSFYKINTMNSEGTVTFGAGFSATEFRCEAPGGQYLFMFQPASAFNLRSLVLLGSPAATNISLRSVSSGQPWNLNVTGGATVQGVDAADSDATGGKPIRAIASKDSLENSNWFFDENWSSWIGAAGGSFHTAENWSPVGAPGASSRVSIQGPNAATLTAPVTIRELLVGGTLTALTNLTVAEDMTVQANGTVSLSRPTIVSNDVYVLADGRLTQSANPAGAAEVYKLDLTVCGDLTVDTNGLIDVTGKGYAAGYGPAPGNNGTGGSYGGRGAGLSGPCYGSVTAPTNLGSSGWSVAGGGAVLLTVKGTVRHNGLLAANGVVGQYSQGQSAGGTISLTAGALRGNGAIQANGLGSGGYASGGGRIALVVTNAGADFLNFMGAVSATVGGSGGAGAGTIYRQTAADGAGRGTVWVDQPVLTFKGYTEAPPAFPGNVPGEASRAVFHVANDARLRLTNDFTVGDIWLDAASAWLDLGSNTLTVKTREHPLGSGFVTNYGHIVWSGLAPGALIIVK